MPFARKSGKPKAFLNEAGLYDYAVKALGRAMRTEAHLSRQLTTALHELEALQNRRAGLPTHLARIDVNTETPELPKQTP